jgi:hypothetical protein
VLFQLPGMAADSTFIITGSASWLPGQKRAIVEARKLDDGDRPDQAEVRFRWVV